MKSQLTICTISLLCICVANACSPKPKCANIRQTSQAKAVFYAAVPGTTNTVTGTITFTKVGDTTTITGTLRNIPDGQHGFHIHTYGDFTSCTDASGHYNPFSKNHGGPTDDVRHVGDLGNIVATGGTATINLSDKLVTLDGEHSVVGRMLVVHQNRDDLGKGGNAGSLTTGNAGPRIACAVIGATQ